MWNENNMKINIVNVTQKDYKYLNKFMLKSNTVFY